LILHVSPALETGTLRVVKVDGTTRKPIPARVSVRGPDGNWRWGLDARGQPLQYGGLPDPQLYREIERRLREVVLDFQLEPR
jgi:hypothetical protein